MKLSNGEWINSKALLYSTGNYSQHPAINQNGKEHEKDCVCVCVCVCVLLLSHLVVSSSALAHRLPCSSLSPAVCSNSWPLSRRCHPTSTSSVVPFSSCLQSFPASGSFPMSRFFASGGQSIGVLASASVLPMNFQG